MHCSEAGAGTVTIRAATPSLRLGKCMDDVCFSEPVARSSTVQYGVVTS